MPVDSPIMTYQTARDQVQRLLQHGSRKATEIKRILACRIVDIEAGVGCGAEPRSHHERESAVHIRKMLAEGEIEEEMQNKRLFYKLPV